MPYGARLNWKGDEIRRKVAAAAALGVDRTLADAVRKAKADHPAYPPASAPGERFATRTGFLEGSIKIVAAAAPAGPLIGGQWGADANYALYVELGTSRKGSGAPRAQVRAAEGGGNMWAIPGPASPPQMAARYTLRPAATEAYRLLPMRIGAAFRGEELL